METSDREILYRGDTILTLEALPGYSRPVVVKMAADSHPPAHVLDALDTEYASAKALADVDGVRRVLGREPIAGQAALILEYVDGETLREHVASQKPDLRARLEIAARLAGILEEMHGRHYAHLALSGDNILIDTNDRAVHFIDLGAAVSIAGTDGRLVSPNQPLGNLAYISPEQTGRVNRTVDERSDLYTLGVVLYELVVQRLPFTTDNSIELVHHHLSRTPLPVTKANPDVPPVVGMIIAKLLRKDADDRYHTARGVRADLEKCLRRLEADGAIETFEVAAVDYNPRLILPQKLYGRERELDELVGFFFHACRKESTLVLVNGYSGVGKTALVQELHRSVAECGGTFVRGKFDQYLQTSPYSAMIQAFSEFVSRILALPEDEFLVWRDRIQAAVGDLGGVLTEIMPTLEDVIGPQPEMPLLGGQEAENRFQHVFGKFLQTVATPRNPLVLFIDDMHWIDVASLGLLRAIRSGQDVPGLLLVGAYRDNEVDEDHPLSEFIRSSKGHSMPLRTLALASLEKEDIDKLLVDALGKRNGIDELGTVVYRSTRGNPFFTRRLLTSLVVEEWIRFDPGKRAWIWDLEGIPVDMVTADSEVLMARDLEELPADSREVLGLAACIGSRFEPAILALISGRDQSELSELLGTAERGLFVRSMGDAFEFVHDQVQEAALLLVDDQKRRQKHLELARLLLANIDESALDDRVFDIVAHYNLSTGSLADPEERLRVAELNLLAASRSRFSFAFTAATSYLEQGLELLGSDRWRDHYVLTLKMHDALIEARFLAIDYDEIPTLFDAMCENVVREVDLWWAHRMMIMTLIGRNKLQEAVTLAENYLEKLGVTLETERTSDLPAAEFLALPRLEDETQGAVMEILMSITAPLGFLSPERFPALFCTMLNIMSRHGNCEASSLAAAWHAALLCAEERFEEGLAFGQLAADLVEKYPSPGMATKVWNMHCAWIRHWKEPVGDLIAPLKEYHRIGLRAGEIEWCLYCLGNQTLLLWGVGRPLADYLAEAGPCVRLCENKGQEVTFLICSIYAQAAVNLRGGTDRPLLLEGEWFSEAEMLPALEGNAMVLSFFGVAKLTLSILFDRPEEAYKLAGELLVVRPGLVTHYLNTKISFYGALACIAARADGEKETARRERLAGFERELRLWAGQAPMNFRHQLDLVLAEKARADGESWEAVRHYGKAIARARENRFLHDEALANELCGRFWLDNGDQRLATVYIQEARQLYKQWGATAKVTHLERKHPQLFEADGRPQDASGPTTAILAPARIDEMSLMEAMQALSSKTDLRSLLIRMTELVMACSGASMATFLLRREGDWFVQAHADVRKEQEVLLLDLPLVPDEGHRIGFVPTVIFDSCRRSNRALVVEDIQRDVRWSEDPEIADREVKSLACLPVVHQGKILAMLYLEHQQMAGVFSPDRIEILEHLLAQLGISLENARLYGDLKQRLRELNRSEERYTLAVAGADSGIWDWDIEKDRIFYSDRLQELLGHEPGDFSDSLDEFWVRMHPEDADRVRETLDRHHAHREPFFIDCRLRTADGGYRWFHARGKTNRSGSGQPVRMSGSLSDITDRKEAEEALARSENYFRSLMEQAPLALEILAPDGRITEINSAWLRLWGVDEGEAAEVLAKYNMLTDDRIKEQGFDQMVRAAFTGETVILPPFKYDTTSTADDIGVGGLEPRSPWIQSHLTPIKDEAGNILCVLNAYVDLTEIKEAEKMTRRHREALARVDRASSLGQVTGSIAHELNQPLTGILSNAQAAELMIASGQADRDELAEVMAEIVSDTKRAGDVIRNLRDLYREQMGDFRPVDLNSVVLETTRLLRGEIVLHHVVLTMDCKTGELEVLGNRIQIQQVIVNLVMNAIQAVQVLDRDLRRIRITTTRQNGEIALQVEDRGQGIDIDRIDQIFQPLATWKPGGTGMGLAISNSIILAHGGRMTAKNRPSGGASVGFTLPVPEEGE